MPRLRAILLVLLLIAAGGAWRALYKPASVVIPPAPATKAAATPVAAASASGAKPKAALPKPSAPPADTDPEPTADADNAISTILAAPSTEHAATAVRLSALVLDPKRTAEQRAEALSHVLNLSAGHEADVLLPLIRDPKLSADDCRTILDDALNQSADWQADVYLAALRSRTEPELRKFIREHLVFLTDGPDLGDKPEAWVEPLIQAAAKRLK